MAEVLDLISPEALSDMALGGLRAIITLLIAYFLTRLVSRLILSLRVHLIDVMERGAGGSPDELEKRATTLIGMIRRVTMLAIWVLAVVMSLRSLGFDVGPILAGAGVVGLAVGFGAQNLVRDMITGLFMLIENQVRVNDVAIINGTGGLVEEVNLRTTVLRSLDGTVHVFPNGTINTLSNMTREYSYHVFDLGVAYKEDVDRVMEVIREVGRELENSEPYSEYIIEPLEILGVDQFADSAVVIKGRIKTQPIQQWAVGREFNRRIKHRFDAEKIEIPFPHRSLYFGEATQPFRFELQTQEREALKDLIRQVLAESGKRGPGSVSES
jgi:moderate conductance mechanosensitive channel